MSKNNRLINSMKRMAEKNRQENIAKASSEMVPQIYAAIAIALHRTYGFGYKRINDVFYESQRILEKFSGTAEEMIAQCEKETGIVIRSNEDNLKEVVK